MLKFIFFKILFMSAAFTASGALVILCEKAFSKVLSRRVLFRLWLVPIILSLVQITAPVIRFPVAARFDFSGVPEIQYSLTPHENTAPQNDAPTNENHTPLTAQTPSSVPVREKGIDIDFCMILAYIYFALALFIIIAHIIGAMRFSYKFRRFSATCEKDIPAELLERAGVKRRVGLFYAEGSFSPFVYGVFRPKITVPDGNISPEVLLHELIHIKRNDLLFMSVMNFVKAVHFFNPFTYVYSARIKKAMELSCDEEASLTMDNAERLSYSKSLISCSAPISHGALYLSENGKYIKERIELVMKNKKRGKCVKIVSIFIVLAVVLFQTAFAAAINDLSPEINYGIQITSDMRGGRYVILSSENVYNGSEGSAAIVNTPFYKNFSAKLTMREIPTQPLGKLYELKIDMNSLIKTMYDGRAWKGLFTVTFDGNVVMDNAVGYINNVPGDYNSSYASLCIEDDDKTVEIDVIYFDISFDSIINYEYEEASLRNFKATTERHLDYGDYYDTLSIRANEELSLFDLQNFPYGENRITSVPGDKYVFDNDSVSGRFLIEYSRVIKEEFYGTLSGIHKNSMTLKSEDGDIDITLDSLTEDEYHYTNPYDSVPLSELPFTLELAPDRKSVILTIRDDFADDWFYSYASYVSEPYNVYTDYESSRGARKTFLPLSHILGTHNLQFTSYRTEPYMNQTAYDITYHIKNGKLLFTNCQRKIEEDEALFGTAAEEYILNHSMLSSVRRFIYDENGNFVGTNE